MNHHIRKTVFAYAKNKGTDQLCSNCTADQHLCFCPLASTMVCVGPVWKPECWFSHSVAQNVFDRETDELWFDVNHVIRKPGIGIPKPNTDKFSLEVSKKTMKQYKKTLYNIAESLICFSNFILLLE